MVIECSLICKRCGFKVDELGVRLNKSLDSNNPHWWYNIDVPDKWCIVNDKLFCPKCTKRYEDITNKFTKNKL